MQVFLFFSIVCATFAALDLKYESGFNDVGSQQTQGSPWPTPKKMTTSKTQLNIDAEYFMFNLKMFPASTQCGIMQAAFSRYGTMLFGPLADAVKFYPRNYDATGMVSSLTVSISSGNCTGYPNLNSDESCKYPRLVGFRRFKRFSSDLPI